MKETKEHTAQLLLYRLTTAATTSILSSTLSEIRLLSKHDPQIRTPLANYNLIPILTHLLLLENQEDIDDNNIFIQENACATMLNLSISTPESLMSTPSTLPALCKALRNADSHAINQHAAATLYSLLSVESYRPIIGSKPEIISGLISILKNPIGSPTRSVKDALKALFGIALYPLNRHKLIELGVVPVLFLIVGRDERVGVVEDASAVIAQVAACCESLEGFRGVNGVRVLVELVREGKGVRVRENAVSGLLSMVMSGGEKAVEELREVDHVEEVVRGLAENGSTERGRRKGMELLKVLEGARRRSWNHLELDRHKESSGRYSSSVGSNSSF